MTERRSQIINPCWLHPAGPAQAICADQLSVRSRTTNPHSPAGSAWQLGWENCIYSHTQKAKRRAETTVESTVSALYP